MSRPSLTAALLRGALAGAAGTAAMDLFWQARQNIRGATEAERPRGDAPIPASRPSPSRTTWVEEDDEAGEADEAVDWSTAPAPARVGKRVYEGVTQHALEARFAQLTGTVVHWGYGMWWGSVFGLATFAARRSGAGWGPLFGAAVWGTSYLLLPVTGLYRPVWEYRAAELAPDLLAHLIYGTGTAAVFSLIARDTGR